MNNVGGEGLFESDISALTFYQILELRSCITPVPRTSPIDLLFVRCLPPTTRIFGLAAKDGIARPSQLL